MNRTRITFFSILAVTLGIVTLSIALQLIQTGTINQIFIACTIFSVGVVMLDFLGILGNDQDGDMGSDSSDIDGGDLDGTDFDSSDFGNVDFGSVDSGGADSGGAELDSIDVDTGGSSGESHIGDVAVGEADTSPHISDIDSSSGNLVLSILSHLRLLVYFCLGFGPTGWVGILMGYSALFSLLIAIPIGVISLFLAQAFFRLQRSDTDSSIKEHDLLHEQAVVTIPLTHTTMGKVRVQLGMNVTERYALATEPNASFQKGDQVRITQVTDDCVYVL